MKKKVYFEITQWPAGKSLDVGLGNGCSTVIAGVHGGGVGHTIKKFKVDVAHLKRVIAELCEEEEE